ncbi:MAG TPA: dienelactone hydrolase family protein [Phenylobacterium sp.]|uniref:dienelactone hydrolase family protein n=1 Tax=Phenylobacterium sp. TaxID=1871053 RepID=UPI002B461DF7|nr:dienelactone hydrolase family protein [Phenylobacterium sp.]HKR87049.1 dienelactone hydrolase family protein [Phenylobacterium sp.]
MGETITLKSRFDGFELAAYRAAPGDARRGGLVLVQEIFGVTEHIRELCEGFAEDGYEVIAPSFYDRAAPGFTADYSPASIEKGRELSAAAPWDQVQGDLQAAIDFLEPPVFAAGYCWGGAAAWLAACRCEGLAAAACFYGRRISELVDETPKVPTILHFGKTDPTIPLAKVEEIRERHPDLPVFLYDAGHGFVSDRRADYDADCARLARLRTLAHFSRSGGGRGEI